MPSGHPYTELFAAYQKLLDQKAYVLLKQVQQEQDFGASLAEVIKQDIKVDFQQGGSLAVIRLQRWLEIADRIQKAKDSVDSKITDLVFTSIHRALATAVADTPLIGCLPESYRKQLPKSQPASVPEKRNSLSSSPISFKTSISTFSDSNSYSDEQDEEEMIFELDEATESCAETDTDSARRSSSASPQPLLGKQAEKSLILDDIDAFISASWQKVSVDSVDLSSLRDELLQLSVQIKAAIEQDCHQSILLTEAFEKWLSKLASGQLSVSTRLFLQEALYLAFTHAGIGQLPPVASEFVSSHCQSKQTQWPQWPNLYLNKGDELPEALPAYVLMPRANETDQPECRFYHTKECYTVVYFKEKSFYQELEDSLKKSDSSPALSVELLIKLKQQTKVSKLLSEPLPALPWLLEQADRYSQMSAWLASVPVSLSETEAADCKFLDVFLISHLQLAEILSDSRDYLPIPSDLLEDYAQQLSQLTEKLNQKPSTQELIQLLQKDYAQKLIEACQQYLEQQKQKIVRAIKYAQQDSGSNPPKPNALLDQTLVHTEPPSPKPTRAHVEMLLHDARLGSVIMRKGLTLEKSARAEDYRAVNHWSKLLPARKQFDQQLAKIIDVSELDQAELDFIYQPYSQAREEKQTQYRALLKNDVLVKTIPNTFICARDRSGQDITRSVLTELNEATIKPRSDSDYIALLQKIRVNLDPAQIQKIQQRNADLAKQESYRCQLVNKVLVEYIGIKIIAAKDSSDVDITISVLDEINQAATKDVSDSHYESCLKKIGINLNTEQLQEVQQRNKCLAKQACYRGKLTNPILVKHIGAQLIQSVTSPADSHSDASQSSDDEKTIASESSEIIKSGSSSQTRGSLLSELLEAKKAEKGRSSADITEQVLEQLNKATTQEEMSKLLGQLGVVLTEAQLQQVLDQQKPLMDAEEDSFPKKNQVESPVLVEDKKAESEEYMAKKKVELFKYIYTTMRNKHTCTWFVRSNYIETLVNEEKDPSCSSQNLWGKISRHCESRQNSRSGQAIKKLDNIIENNNLSIDRIRAIEAQVNQFKENYQQLRRQENGYTNFLNKIAGRPDVVAYIDIQEYSKKHPNSRTARAWQEVGNGQPSSRSENRIPGASEGLVSSLSGINTRSVVSGQPTPNAATNNSLKSSSSPSSLDRESLRDRLNAFL